MQGAGEGRELSITFQTSGKAVRLSAPEKWRKAVAGEDIKPDSWVEIHRQGGSPQTVRADDVPELRALFVELGLAPAAPGPAVDQAAGPAEPVTDEAAAAPVMAPVPRPAPAAAGFGGARETALPPPPRSQLGPEGRRLGGGIAAFVIGLIILTNILRSCGDHGHRADLSSPPSSQISIAVDGSAPSAAPTVSAADPAAQAQVQAQADAGQAGAAAEVPAAGAGPSFDCGRAASDTLRLVCATPDLAAADRTLAAAYQAALAATTDPAGLRDSERAWIAARDAAPADADQLRALYAERIQALRDAAKGAEPF